MNHDVCVTRDRLRFQTFTLQDMPLILGRSACSGNQALNLNCIEGYDVGKYMGCAVHRRQKVRPFPKPKKNEFFELNYDTQLSYVWWLPDQIYWTQSVTCLNGHEYRLSYQATYNCICTQRGCELKRDLFKAMCQIHTKRAPRCKGKILKGEIHYKADYHEPP